MSKNTNIASLEAQKQMAGTDANNLRKALVGKDYVDNKIIEAIALVLLADSPTIAKMKTAVQGILEEYPDYLNMRSAQRLSLNAAIAAETEAIEGIDLAEVVTKKPHNFEAAKV